MVVALRFCRRLGGDGDAAAEDEKKSSLLLPEHVIVMDEGVEILRPPTPQETSDFEVEYLTFADDNTRVSSPAAWQSTA